MKSLDLNIFEIKNNLKARTGRLLISEPLSDDNYFSRSVVLLTEHTKEGSVGFVLNKLTDYHLNDLVDELNKNWPIYQGGPIEPNTLHFVYQSEPLPGALKVKEGLYWGGDFEALKMKISAGLLQENQIQFFIGYSGWYAEQLDNELNHSFWIVSNFDESHQVLNQSPSFWKTCVKNMGDDYKLWLNVPDNPNLN
ncbi:MAG: YqgE/AlgH family protein [Bacteroidales bacterium]|nr:YqgE/AlgH family protein [Bacteroidales bacterium]